MNESAQNELQGCSHEICRCTQMGPIAGETFCSDYCKNTSDDAIETEVCACGHPACDTPQ